MSRPIYAGKSGWVLQHPAYIKARRFCNVWLSPLEPEVGAFSNRRSAL